MCYWKLPFKYKPMKGAVLKKTKHLVWNMKIIQMDCSKISC